MEHAMTHEELRSIMKHFSLRACDVAWIAGVHDRQVKFWLRGHSRIPQSAALLLLAYRQGRVTTHWFRRNISQPIPYVSTDPTTSRPHLTKKAKAPQQQAQDPTTTTAP
jgi:hypothetical protein